MHDAGVTVNVTFTNWPLLTASSDLTEILESETSTVAERFGLLEPASVSETVGGRVIAPLIGKGTVTKKELGFELVPGGVTFVIVTTTWVGVPTVIVAGETASEYLFAGAALTMLATEVMAKCD